ncbi:MAG: hypothetical protein QOD84_2487 [Acidobacteriaceae bacterium]|jgi:hypothetical protein
MNIPSIAYFRQLATFALLFIALSVSAQPQGQAAENAAFPDPVPQPNSASIESAEAEICGVRHLDDCLKDLLGDQIGIWTSPFRLRGRDAVWLLPFAGATALAIHYDADALRQLGGDKGRIDASHKIAAFGSPWVTGGGAAAVYFLGAATHNDKLAETGRLGAEAVIDASIVAEGLKLATNRQRPEQGDGTGKFWPDGTRIYSVDSAFPSGHAAASWALARVVAGEYPGIWTKLGAYGFATAISVSRVTGNNHFPSDALVGSAVGYLVGGYVLHHHGDSTFSYNIAPIVDASTRSFGFSATIPTASLGNAATGLHSHFQALLHRRGENSPNYRF